MKILFFTLGNELVASSRTRVFQYLPHLRNKGVVCKIIQYQSGFDYWLLSNFKKETIFQKIIFAVLFKGLGIFHFFYSFFAAMRLIVLAKKYDILFIQKALPPVWVQKIVFRRNSRIVFDFDDAIYANEAAYDVERFNFMCSCIKLAVIENESTETYMNSKGIKTLKITGPIDCGRYKPKTNLTNSPAITIGWIGSGSTTGFLQLIEKALKQISKKYPNVVINFIGSSGFKIDECRIVSEKWSLETEVQLLEKFDIGIMPLPDNEWTRGKGGYKILQYMAMGIPSIASPVGVNKEIIIQNETGILAESEEEWLTAFEKLITEHDLSIQLGNNARIRAKNNYSFAASTPVLLDAIRKLILA